MLKGIPCISIHETKRRKTVITLHYSYMETQAHKVKVTAVGKYVADAKKSRQESSKSKCYQLSCIVKGKHTQIDSCKYLYYR